MHALLLATSLLLGADAPADGFYLRSTADDAPTVTDPTVTGRTVTAPDGRTFALGERRELEIKTSWINAQDDAEADFSLSVTIPFDADLRPNSYLLILNGRAFPQGGSGATRRETSNLSFSLPGEEHAERAAALFNTPIYRRRHPGHKLLVTFTPAQKTFRLGSEVKATFHIKNVGDAPFAFWQGGHYRGAGRDNQYTFAAYRYGAQVADVGTTNHMGGMMQLRTVESGEVFEDEIDLRKWFAFDEPGHYAVHGAYSMMIEDSSDEPYLTRWKDHASADFLVWIKPVPAEAPADAAGEAATTDEAATTGEGNE